MRMIGVGFHCFFLLLCVVYAQQIPYDWQPRVAQAQMLFANPEPSSQLMASIGNGYLATVIGTDTVYVSGLFNGRNTVTPSHRAKIPSSAVINVATGVFVGAAIDLERATYLRRYTVGSSLIEQRWYAHRTIPSLLVHEIYVDNNQNTPLVVNLKPGGPYTTNDLVIDSTITGPNYVSKTAHIAITEEPNGTVVTLTWTSTNVPTSITAGANQAQTFYFITSIRTSLDSKNTPVDSLNDYMNAVNNAGFLYGQHTQAWLGLWSSRIELTGNLHLSRVVNASTYYILSSVRADWPYSLSPGGLASNGYNGHTFWDCETWMYPSILITRHELALGGLLNYRFNRQDGAALKAKSYNKGYLGLMFPWESAFAGQEVCPVSAPTGLYEQHITGDIAFAYKQYWDLTHNVTWLQQVYPLIYGIASFWASRVSFNSQNRLYEINGIIPPDEYAVNVNNSVYTNAVASISLDFAVFTGSILNHTVPPTWSIISKNIKIPIDTVNQIHLEYDTYKGETIKQADVILLGFPLQFPMSEQLRLNDLVYYQQRTDRNGPAMTYAMETIAWLELANFEEAAKLWDLSFANAQSPYMVWTETPQGGTVNFITGAGGFLQGVLFGYGGIRIQDNSLYFNPQLPPGVSQVTFNEIYYLGNKIKISYNAIHLEVTNLSTTGGTAISIQPYQEVAEPLFPLEPFTSVVSPCTIFPSNGFSYTT